MTYRYTIYMKNGQKISFIRNHETANHADLVKLLETAIDNKSTLKFKDKLNYVLPYETIDYITYEEV